MPRPKKPTAPAIRVSNALITNILQSMDERILSKIDASEPAKQELRIAGKPINGITPAMHAIMLYIGQKIAEKYADQQELIDRNCKEWAEKGKEQLFKDSFANSSAKFSSNKIKNFRDKISKYSSELVLPSNKIK